MSNRWWEIQVLCHPALEESVFWRLEKFGCRGTATETKPPSFWVRAFLPEVEVQVLDLAALSLWLCQDALLMGLPQPETRWHLIDEEDWAGSWKQHWQPREVGDRLLICPAWLTPASGSERIVIQLDPGMAFGTGEHPTTQLCLEALEMRLAMDAESQTIADIGCGSGILSLSAVLLGGRQLVAVDIDPLAVQAARYNRQLNQIEASRLAIAQGSVEQLQQHAQAFDGILCNILAEVIVPLIPQISQIAKPKAWGILSGILLEQSADVAATVEQHGWVVAAIWRKEQWCCINIRRA